MIYFRNWSTYIKLIDLIGWYLSVRMTDVQVPRSKSLVHHLFPSEVGEHFVANFPWQNKYFIISTDYCNFSRLEYAHCLPTRKFKISLHSHKTSLLLSQFNKLLMHSRFGLYSDGK